MLLYINVLIISHFLHVDSAVVTSNITDFSKCKVHYSRSESAYTTFFEITDNFRGNSSLIFDFHFSVLAPRDAHILLSPSAQIGNSDPVYEIVLGAGGNTFSDIRRLQKAAVQQSAKTKNLLSSLDIKSFWLHVSNDGLIEIGSDGEELAFLSWQDSDPLPIQVFSFCTWPGVEAKWYYDCQREDGSVSNSKEIEKNLTITEKLRQQLLRNYDPYVRPVTDPDDLTEVYVELTYHSISLDEMSSKFILHGTMLLHWVDEKISWDPNEFGNTESLYFPSRQIWQPDLLLYNSASVRGFNFLKSSTTVIGSDGFVEWKTPVNIDAWCDTSGLGHWPIDEHTCEIQLGFWTEDKFLILEASKETKQEEYFNSEWKVIKVESGHYLIPAPWNGDQDLYTNTFVISFTLRRSSSTYTAIYFTPLLAVALSLLGTFWLSPNGPIRISLHCFQLVILSLFLTKLGLSIPSSPTSVPYIVLLYCYGYMATLVALLFTVILTNLAHTKHSKQLPYFIYKFFSLKYMKSILYVHGSKFSESYDKLIDENTSSKDNIDIQEMWGLVGIALDRLLFLTYFLIIIVCLCKSY